MTVTKESKRFASKQTTAFCSEYQGFFQLRLKNMMLSKITGFSGSGPATLKNSLMLQPEMVE